MNTDSRGLARLDSPPAANAALTTHSATGDVACRRWRVLALLSVAVLLAMSLWFTASASAEHFRLLWQLDAGQVAALTTAVQLGFVAGTAMVAVLNLADLIPSRRLFAACAAAAAGCNALILVAPGFHAALALRFATGLLLAGVYPPAMKMAATWFLAARGLAIGTVVGALTVGKAAPYLVHALAGSVDPRLVTGSTSAGAVAAAALIAASYHDGPYAFPRRTFSWSLVGVAWRDRPTRLAIAGYLGHMWELYAGWATLGSFFFYFFDRKGLGGAELITAAAVMTFAGIAIGGLGSVIAGLWADRWGRENVAAGAMIVSGSCALVLGWLGDAPVALVVSVALVWGFSIVADSAQFSALVTEVAPAHAVGTALTLQTSVGFALTAVSIWLTVEVAETVGWGPAFSILAIGPALGVAAIIRLKNSRLRTE